MKPQLPFSSRSLLVLAGAVRLTTAKDARLVADGATNTLADVTSSITGTVAVGGNGRLQFHDTPCRQSQCAFTAPASRKRFAPSASQLQSQTQQQKGKHHEPAN